MNYQGIDITSEIIVIVGATAVGKSQLAIELAKELQCEIISGDAYQVYQKMDIGTAKVSQEEQQGIKHHLIDIIDYRQEYDVQKFQTMARAIIDEKLKAKEKIIICGGTGLYINAVLYKYDFKEDENFVKTQKIVSEKSLEELQNYIQEKAITVNESDYGNKRRLTNIVTNDYLGISNNKQGKEKYYGDFQIIGITLPREQIYKRIDQRVEKMFGSGLITEVKQFEPGYRSQQAIGYKEVHQLLNNELTEQATIELVQKNTRNFAKRQNTWFKNKMEVTWYERKDGKWILVKT